MQQQKERPEERRARHDQLRAQALRERETQKFESTKPNGIAGFWSNLAVKWTLVIFGALITFFWVIIKGVFGLIRKYPRHFAMIVTFVTAAAIGFWRAGQGLTTDDKRFMAFGLAVLGAGIYIISERRSLGNKAYPMGGMPILFGAAMLYISFF